jgi:hypothetical protein
VRIPRCAIVVVILSAVFVVGCGGDEAKPVDLKGTTNTSAFDGMKEQMTKDLKGGNKAPKAETKTQ